MNENVIECSMGGGKKTYVHDQTSDLIEKIERCFSLSAKAKIRFIT